MSEAKQVNVQNANFNRMSPQAEDEMEIDLLELLMVMNTEM